jgi:transcriptional regulator with XRE-family HTH domain
MNAPEFAALRNALGMSRNKLADALGLNERSIRRYESGERPIPKTVQMALVAYARMPKEK